MSLGMDSGGPGYQDKGAQSSSLSGSPNRHSSSRVGASREEEERGRVFSGGKRRASPVYDDYCTGPFGAREKVEEKSLATYNSWSAGSQALKFSTSASSSHWKSERLMSPYGDCDMDDSSFFAHTTRLNIVGPKSSSARILKRRSLSTERLLMTYGERTMTTAATSTMTPPPQEPERARSRSPPIPTLIPEKPTLPTESYTKLSLRSSRPLPDPTASRKLLVLDLNGTLLLRSAHSGRRAPPPSYTRVRNIPPNPTLRTIHPRPYLPSFRAYLFHPTTLRWLDTMVWSSAQPHSVNDMVDKCFGMHKQELKAVWARDTLGLTSDEYYKKTQTTKDLAKPWAQIPSVISNPLASHNQSPELLSAPHQPENPPSEVKSDTDSHSHTSLPQQQHSALTTILMDDSPLKAVLQPWNHLCVSEYGAERRKVDVEIAERDWERMWLAERDNAKKLQNLEAAAEEEGRTGDEASSGDMAMKSSEEIGKETERKRKRREKKLLKKEGLLLAKEKERVEEGSYDEMLLAVIGILERLKREGNVAGWIRSGGLVGAVGDQEAIPESNGSSAKRPAPVSENVETATAPTRRIAIASPPTTLPHPSTKRDSPPMSLDGPSFKRRKLTRVSISPDTEVDPVLAPGERVLELDSDDMTVPATPTSIKRSPSPSLPSSPVSFADVEQESTGVLPTATSGTKALLSTEIPTPASLLWYETSSALSHWAQHGRRALTELGIEIVSGVVAPSQNNGNVTNGQSTGYRGVGL